MKVTAVLFFLLQMIVLPCQSESTVMSEDSSLITQFSLSYDNSDESWYWRTGLSGYYANSSLYPTEIFYKHFHLSKEEASADEQEQCIAHRSPDKNLICEGEGCLCACFLQVENDFFEKEVVPGVPTIQNNRPICCLHGTCYDEFFRGRLKGVRHKQNIYFGRSAYHSAYDFERLAETNAGGKSNAIPMLVAAIGSLSLAYIMGYDPIYIKALYEYLTTPRVRRACPFKDNFFI